MNHIPSLFRIAGRAAFLGLLSLGALSLSACEVEETYYYSELYDECVVPDDCADLSATCKIVNADWGNVRSSAGVCTFGCADDYDCPTNRRSEQGICVDADGAGGLCYEYCLDDYDCDAGFACSFFNDGTGEGFCLPY